MSKAKPRTVELWASRDGWGRLGVIYAKPTINLWTLPPAIDDLKFSGPSSSFVGDMHPALFAKLYRRRLAAGQCIHLRIESTVIA